VEAVPLLFQSHPPTHPPMHTPRRPQVMFGGDGNDMRRTAVAPQPRAAPRPKGEGKVGVKEEGGR